MRKRFIVALFLCIGLVFGATTPQPSELKKVPKSEIAKLLRLHEFFYQPLMEMFALMNDYDALDKDMAQVVYRFNLDNALLLELINATEQKSDAFRFVNKRDNTGAITGYENVDIYADESDSIIVFDLRNVLPY
ncbi:MAG: hypothetical protein K2N12_05125 [Helicobacter sp.]|nr:hypothetical protein [Helicobacter sp.]